MYLRRQGRFGKHEIVYYVCHYLTINYERFMKFFLVTTDHFSDRLWFKDDEDFVAAMNYVAVTCVITGINVLTFILMSNHTHFVLYCYRPDAKYFIDTFKKLYGSYFCRKYRQRDYFRRVKVDIREISTQDEGVEKAVAYVQMNSVAANICPTPYFYRWGTGSSFFNENPLPGDPVESLSRRAQIRMVRSNVKLPKTFRFGKDGYILPDSYIKKEFVESIFKTPKRYNYFLRSSSKAKKTIEREALPSFSDQNILASSRDLCRSLFRTDLFDDLNKSQKAELLKQLRYRFSADIAQLCRVLGTSYEEAANMLDY